MRESGQSGQIAIVPNRMSGHPFKNKTKAKMMRKKTKQSTGTVWKYINIHALYLIITKIFLNKIIGSFDQGNINAYESLDNIYGTKRE